jgi:hypothetical protein
MSDYSRLGFRRSTLLDGRVPSEAPEHARVRSDCRLARDRSRAVGRSRGSASGGRHAAGLLALFRTSDAVANVSRVLKPGAPFLFTAAEIESADDNGVTGTMNGVPPMERLSLPETRATCSREAWRCCSLTARFSSPVIPSLNSLTPYRYSCRHGRIQSQRPRIRDHATLLPEGKVLFTGCVAGCTALPPLHRRCQNDTDSSGARAKGTFSTCQRGDIDTDAERACP